MQEKWYEEPVKYPDALKERVAEACRLRGRRRWAAPPAVPAVGGIGGRRQRPVPVVAKLVLKNNELEHTQALLPALQPYLPFGSGQCLRSVDLSFNALAEVGAAFWGALPRLAQLQLHGNRFETKQAFKELGWLATACPSLSALTLHGGEPRLEVR
eukprot:SAG22_NODE_692_length_7878_cov_6.834812_7_plen_156_part_00